MTFRFGSTAKAKLDTVNPKLAEVAEAALALSDIDFGITEGLRTMEKQQQLVKEGASKTLKSKHLTGNAIDIVAYVDGKVTWELQYYEKIAQSFKIAKDDVGVQIRWGGNWNGYKTDDFKLDPENKFVDAVHFELITT